MATKAESAEKKVIRWKCPKCKNEFDVHQMLLQPKKCPGCGKADLKGIYEK